MENAGIILVFMAMSAFIYFAIVSSIRTTKTAFVKREKERTFSLYEKLVFEGIALSNALIHSKDKHFTEMVRASRELDEWDAKVQRLMKLTLVK